MIGRAGGVALGAAALLLAGALAWRAALAHRANADLHRRTIEAEAEMRRLDGERARLIAEKEALSRDPAYVERRLRELRRTEPGETIVERHGGR